MIIWSIHFQPPVLTWRTKTAMPTFCIAVSRETAIICFVLRQASQARRLPATYLGWWWWWWWWWLWYGWCYSCGHGCGLNGFVFGYGSGFDMFFQNSVSFKKDNTPRQAKDKRSHDMEPGNNRVEISGERHFFILIDSGLVWSPVSISAKDCHGKKYDDQKRPCGAHHPLWKIWPSKREKSHVLNFCENLHNITIEWIMKRSENIYKI